MINTLSLAWPPLLSSAVFKLCQGVSAWFMEVWLGVILLQGEPANTSTSSSSKLWIITLSICQHQHLSDPQEEPVAHSSFIPVALSRLARTSGAPAPIELLLYLPFSLKTEIEWSKSRWADITTLWENAEIKLSQCSVTEHVLSSSAAFSSTLKLDKWC